MTVEERERVQTKPTQKDVLTIRGLGAIAAHTGRPENWKEPHHVDLVLEYHGKTWRVCIVEPIPDQTITYEYQSVETGLTPESGDIMRGDMTRAIGSAVMSTLWYVLSGEDPRPI